MGRKTKARITMLESLLDELIARIARREESLEDLYEQVADLTAMVEKLKQESK